MYWFIASRMFCLALCSFGSISNGTTPFGQSFTVVVVTLRSWRVVIGEVELGDTEETDKENDNVL